MIQLCCREWIGLQMNDVAVVGGGVMGQLTALALADRGCKVALLDAGNDIPPASWAGGGILSALFPWRYPDELTNLTIDALARYRRLGERIRGAGGPDPEVQQIGMHVDAGAEVDRAMAWAKDRGISAYRLAATESSLASVGAIALPEVGVVRNPRLLKGLAGLLAHGNVKVQRGVTVRAWRPGGAGWLLETSCGWFDAEKLVLAAGAWAGPLLARHGVSLPLMPVQGEMLLFPAGAPAPLHILLGEEGYVIPRKDGCILAGSTLRPGVEDQRPTEQACKQLKATAASLWPPLASIEPVAQWAGIRPGNQRAWPWLGELPQAPGVFIAAGHYRNGLVSAPASAELLANLICGERPFIDPEPYSVSSSSPP